MNIIDHNIEPNTLNLQDEKTIVTREPRIEKRVDTVAPFYVTLNIKYEMVHNWMLDFGDSHNLIPKQLWSN